jgi:tetratricopeptide (TPR) repeat protein
MFSGCLWISCTGGSEREHILFTGMDSLLEANPDSAYKMLTAMQKKVDSIDEEAVSMRHRMYLASAANKLFLPMPSDSSFMDVVSWYDLHGTANDRMRARYLLGCIYRDRMDAPEALRNYQQALECADTLSPDCDFTTLFSVYGQMATIYQDQYLYDKAIWANSNYSKYAEKAGNNYEWIRGQELLIPLFESKGDTVRIFTQTRKVYDLYINNGMQDKAVRVFPPLIYTFINRGEYEEAKKLMDLYEHKSGLFDNVGNIRSRYSHYYLAKGLYFQGTGRLDSAEYYYRKLIENNHLLDGYNHLWFLFNQKAEKDSISKYSRLLNTQLEKHLNSIQTDAVSQVTSTYDSSKADKQIEAERRYRKTSKFAFLLLSLLFLALLYFFFRIYRKKNNNEDTETATYKEQLNELTNRLGRMGLNAFTHMPSYKHLKSLSGNPHKNGKPAESEWDSLMKEISESLPAFYSFITSDSQLSDLERKTCVLVRLGFKTKEIMVLLGENNMQSVSNLKSKAKKKLFPNSQNHRLEELIRKI